MSLRVFKPFASLMRFSWIVFLVLFVFPPNYWLWGALALGFLQEVLVVLNEKRFKTRPVLIEDQNGKNYLEDMYEGGYDDADNDFERLNQTDLDSHHQFIKDYIQKKLTA